MTLNLALILLGLVGLTYLIYRYARYSNWRSTVIGQAFMMMKTALWAMFTFVVVVRLFPDWSGRQGVSAALLSYVVLAIGAQIVAVVKLQGGFRRNRETHSGTEDNGSERVA